MNRHSPTLAAWSAHAFTATGVFTALLATLSLFEDKPQACLLWLGVALLVDGVDGSLARRVNVREVLPHFDGSVLDLVIDFLTYVFIPALFIYKYIPLPQYTLLFTTTVILISSLFCFCNVNMKSSDNYFVGFPAAWNVVALCLYILTPPAWLTLVTVLGLAVLTVSPMKFLHPFRVRRFMPVNIAVTFGWLLTSLWLIVIRPELGAVPLTLWLACSAYFVGVCVWRTALEWKGRLGVSRRF
ncbi:phosphatidylcholine synthase [Pseudomonas sp. URIL14HWK12:I9]|nr:phosphatidylcholine synthase [Pseudomonas sp. URIL14HWK12:I12]PVZ27454.1 phosphatidylcholine synthase [Pseudomonas sp. URIL14HWK12:I10]PVZ38343.1 phosphatidylcholine synthase [Pseudomonas sp. URIL14HWK12:I11]SNZ03735.1 phosphatidylcholine synthase [Pseudomonas sp. URIL14HWK12:I9]